MSLVKATKVFIRLLQRAPSKKVAALFTLMVLCGLTEGIGIALFIPLIQVLQPSANAAEGLSSSLFTITSNLGNLLSAGPLLTIFVMLVCLRSLIQYSREQQAVRLQYGLVDDLRRACFSALIRADWRWITGHRRSDLASLLLNDINRVGNGLNFGLAALATLMTMAVYLIAAVLLSWKMTLLVLLSAIFLFVALNGQRHQALRLGQRLSEAFRKMHANVQDSLTGIRLSKTLGLEEAHLLQFEQAMHNLRGQQERFSASTGKTKALFQCSGVALLALYLYVGLEFLSVEVVQLLTLVLIFARLIPLFAALQQQIHQWLHAVPALISGENLLLQGLAAAEQASDTPVNWQMQHAISLRNVHVRYAEREHTALDSVSLDLPYLSTTAIVGPSGSGKSTLADIVAGLLAPDVGTITVDGVPIDASNRLSWRHNVAYMTQDVFLFNDSIRNNLLCGHEEASEDALKEALHQAAADFVFDLPRGLDTQIGDAGVCLSGGERQRLALARALLRKPLLLILDEATSALDQDNELRIRDAIGKLQGTITILIISHKPTTLEHATQMIELDRGRLVRCSSNPPLDVTQERTACPSS
ncbi:ABC transporter ATP-binding protein [Pseudomonas sp. NY15366]